MSTNIVAYKQQHSKTPSKDPGELKPVSVPTPWVVKESTVSRKIISLTPAEMKLWIVIRFQESTPLEGSDDLWCVLTHLTIAMLAGYRDRTSTSRNIHDLVARGWIEARRIQSSNVVAYKTRVPT